jgi:hypothetical protein
MYILHSIHDDNIGHSCTVYIDAGIPKNMNINRLMFIIDRSDDMNL